MTEEEKQAFQDIYWIAFAARNQIAYWKRQCRDTSCSQEAAFEQIAELSQKCTQEEEDDNESEDK